MEKQVWFHVISVELHLLYPRCEWVQWNDLCNSCAPFGSGFQNSLLTFVQFILKIYVFHLTYSYYSVRFLCGSILLSMVGWVFAGNLQWGPSQTLFQSFKIYFILSKISVSLLGFLCGCWSMIQIQSRHILVYCQVLLWSCMSYCQDCIGPTMSKEHREEGVSWGTEYSSFYFR